MAGVPLLGRIPWKALLNPIKIKPFVGPEMRTYKIFPVGFPLPIFGVTIRHGHRHPVFVARPGESPQSCVG